ncbi:MAG: transcription antitermination factor NusB [Pseudomonadota bacterium]
MTAERRRPPATGRGGSFDKADRRAGGSRKAGRAAPPGKDARPPDPETAPAGLVARLAARDLLSLTLHKKWPLDDALKGCRSFGALEGPDRGFARALVSTTLRRLGQIDAAIDALLHRPLGKRGASVQDILRLGAAQLLFLETPPHAAVSLAQHMADQRREAVPLKAVINAVLRKLSDRGPAILAAQPPRLNTPGWLWRSWERAYGPAGAKAIAAAHLREAPLDLTLKPGAGAPAGGAATPSGSLRFAAGTDVAGLDGFERGDWWVQDAAAAMPARLLGPDLKGRDVVDLCAAPGGKTMQLAAAGARVTAVDRSAPRLKHLRDNLARTGLDAAIVEADALEWRPETAPEMILLDAPCSATGTLRRHPDVAWLKTEDDVAAMTALQAKFIAAATRMLAPGGTLIYCVCSLQPEEGERQVEAALRAHTELSRVPAQAEEIGAPAAAITKAGDVRLLPQFWSEIGGMDGFYAARLGKSG